MAVLIEGTSVVVRASAVRTKYEGGAAAFIREIPNKSFCADGELARVGFLAPDDVKAYVGHLERRRLVYHRNQGAIDLVAVDQLTGLCVPCEWASFGSTFRDRAKTQPIKVCCANPTEFKHVVVPDGWEFSVSL